MKLTKITAIAAVFGAALTLSACAGDDATTEETTAAETTTTAEESTEVAPERPTTEDLNEVLARATDSALPMEERVTTVQGGETAPEIFETMTISKEESGADFQVVDPILPGYTPDSVLATVNYTLPDQPVGVAENVEFFYEDDNWKLSQTWACTLVTNTVAPEQVPAMCRDEAGEVPAEDPAGAPVEAPAEAPADAPAEAPAQ